MKKILLFTSILFLTISTSLFAQHPTNLVSSNITYSSVDLSWNDVVCVGNTHFRHRESGTSTWIEYLNIPNNPHLLVGLIPNTSYDWSVKCVGQSGWGTTQTFTTLSVPSISNIVIIDSIACFDSSATIQISINQTSPLTTYKLIFGQLLGTYFVSFGSVDTTNNSVVNIDGIFEGTYVVRLVDSIPYYTANGGVNGTSTAGMYSEWTNLIITETDSLEASTTTIDNNLCVGDCIATQELTITGGTQPYNYTLDADPTVILGPQSYDILTVGNTAFDPPSLTINVGDTVTWINTGGNHNVNATQTTYPFNPEDFGNSVSAGWSFQWIFTLDGTYDYQCDPHVGLGMTGVIIVNPSPLNTSIDTLTNLCAGVYDLVVSDANGCPTSPATTTFLIDTIDAIVLAGIAETILSSSFHISCNGGSDGVINASASGGTGAFTYSIDGQNFSSDNIFDSLTAGPYIITYKDANGCTDTESFTLSAPPALSFAIASLPANCFADSSGEINFILPSGGVGPYQYSVDSGGVYQGPSLFQNLPGDSIYDAMIQDAHGCQDTTSVYISQPTEVFYSTTLSDYSGFEVSCFGDSDGIIDFGTPSGGSGGGYQYSIDGGSTGYSLIPSSINLQADTFYLSVLDGAGCKKDTIVVLNSPSQFVISPIVTSDYNGSQISCNGISDGEITVTQVNGVSPVNYEFDNSGVLSLISSWNSLSAGGYNVQAEDANGCLDVQIIIIVSPLALTATTDSIFEFCNDINGSATVTVTASTGTAPYRYLWSPGGQTTATASGLDAGTYSCVILDTNDCSITETVIVADSMPFVLSFTTTPTCPGSSTGSATVTMTPIGSYSYLWDNTQTTATAIGLPLGNYTVDVTIPGVCTISESVYVDTASTPFSIDTIDVTNISCHDADDGSIEINAIGGFPPFQYSINLGLLQNANSFSNLIEGEYSVQVADNTGCMVFDTISIINPLTIAIDTIIVSPITCSGGNNAAIQAIVGSGGTLPYLYSVNGGQTHSNMSYFINYIAGTYTVEIIDVNNCYSSKPLIIADPNELDVTITPSNWYGNNYQIQCNGDSSGFADITVTGGVGPYIYTALDFNGNTISSSSNSYIDSLRAGTYTFVITDANGCIDTETITYFQPSEIEHNFIITHVNCSGWNNGALIDSVYGGVGSATTYSYLWNNGETTHTIDSLFVGEYIIIVTDENNCISSDTIEVNDNNALAATLIVTDVSCFNFCDGEIMADVTGGAPNNTNGVASYYYLWNDTLAQTAQTALGLCANNVTNSATYACVITDNQGCSMSLSATISQQEELVVTASIVTEISCNLGNDGKLTAAVINGGVGPYLYMWSNNAPNYSASPNNNNVSANTYIITVKDNKGCFGDTSIEILEPSELTLTVGNTDITCYGFIDGKITADADGGTPFLGIPPEYLYTLSGAFVFSQTTDILTAENLIPGLYTIEAEDRNGCKIESGTIYLSEPGDPLTISFNIIDESCMLSDGQVNVDVDGGTSPYVYSWDNSVLIGANIDNLESGFYPITITDSNYCVIAATAFVQGVDNVFLPDNSSSIDSSVCLGASVSLPIQVQPTFSYVWTYNNDTIYSATATNYTDITVTPTEPVNVYTLHITGPNCDTYTITATINVASIDPLPNTNPAPVNGSYATIVKGTSIEIFSDNMDCDIYEWSWNTSTAASRVITETPDASTWYHIAVNSSGCLGLDSIYVVVGVKPYDAITPNGDGYNDVWNVLDIASYPNAVVQVFNRWGGLVHETSGGLDYVAWDGTRNGKELPIGTYYYIIDLKTDDETQNGPITIIR